MEQEFFRETAELYCARFHHLAEIGIVKEMSFDIDSKDFDDKYRDHDIRDAEPFKQMSAQLAEVDELLCLYCREITSPCNTDANKAAVGKFPKHTPRILLRYNSL